MNRERLDSLLREFARKELLAPLGLKDAPFELHEPSTGVKTEVRLLILESGHRGFCLRIYPWYQQWRVRRRLEAEKVLAAHQLPAPRIVTCRNGSLLRGPTILVEERMEGRHLPPEDWTIQRAEKFANTLAAYHQVHSSRHGFISRPLSKSFYKIWIVRVENRLGELRRHGAEVVSFEALAEVAAWFHAWEQPLCDLRRFDLVHDKLNPGNVLWQDNEDRFALLDFETLQFGFRMKDLIQARQDVIARNGRLRKAFEAAYATHWSAAEQDEARRLSPFFEAYHYLSEAAVKMKRVSRGGKYTLPTEGGKFLRNWALLETVVRGESINK